MRMEEFDKRIVFYGTKFKEACQTASRMSWTESEYNAYENAIIAADDAQGKIDYARKEGEINKAIAIATDLLKTFNFAVENIAKLTGLTIDEIEKIKKNL